MKKLFLLILIGFCIVSGFAQQQNREIKVDPRLYEVLGESTVNDLRAHNPKQLVIENCNLVAYCYLALKFEEVEGTYQMKGDLRNVVKSGKSCNYQEIIEIGCINPNDYNLQQDPNLKNIYSLGNTGAYIIVISKGDFEQHKAAALREYGL